ncbi:MAG: endonuclease domain-containing protein [Ruminococcus sp.]
MHIDRNKKLLDCARNLRKEMTRQEKHLWYDFLRNYPVHIYKQRIIGNYIVDFYCPSAHLVIELDGSQHFTVDGMEYDKIRTEFLEQYNLRVLRISNIDIDKNFDGTCENINHEIKNGETHIYSHASCSEIF